MVCVFSLIYCWPTFAHEQACIFSNEIQCIFEWPLHQKFIPGAMSHTGIFFLAYFFLSNFWTSGGSGRALYGQENNDLLDFGDPKRVDTIFQQLKLESCRS